MDHVNSIRDDTNNILQPEIPAYAHFVIGVAAIRAAIKSRTRSIQPNRSDEIYHVFQKPVDQPVDQLAFDNNGIDCSKAG